MSLTSPRSQAEFTELLFFWSNVYKKGRKSYKRGFLVLSVTKKTKQTWKEQLNIRSLKWDFGLWQGKLWLPCLHANNYFKIPEKVLLALCNMTKQSLLIKNYATFFPLVICVHFWNLCKIKGFFKGTPYLRYFLKVSICLAGNTVVSDLFLSPSNTVMCS